MDRALRQAWWALAAVCGVTLVSLAIAQTTTYSSPSLPNTKQQSIWQPVALSLNRPLEIRIELAWLADPVTFPYALDAHVTTGGIEVCGRVPSPAVRDWALFIARQQGPLMVVDRLQIQANLAAQPLPCKAEQLQTIVLSYLKTACPDWARDVRASCNDRGQVTLTGTAASREDKVAVAEQLRYVPGCRCVVNQLRVPGVTEEPLFVVTFAGVPPDPEAVTNVPEGIVTARLPDIEPMPEPKPAPNGKPSNLVSPSLLADPAADRSPMAPAPMPLEPSPPKLPGRPEINSKPVAKAIPKDGSPSPAPVKPPARQEAHEDLKSDSVPTLLLLAMRGPASTCMQAPTSSPRNDLPPVKTVVPNQIALPVPPPPRPETNLQAVVPPILKDAPAPPAPVAPPTCTLAAKIQNSAAASPPLPPVTAPTTTAAPSQLVLPAARPETNSKPVAPATPKDGPPLPVPVAPPAGTVAAKAQNSGFASIQRPTALPDNNLPPVKTPAPTQIVPPPQAHPQTNLQTVVPPTIKDAPPPAPVAPPALPVVPPAQNNAAVGPASPAMKAPAMAPASSQLVLPPPLTPESNSRPAAQAIPKDGPPPPTAVTPPVCTVAAKTQNGGFASIQRPSTLPANNVSPVITPAPSQIVPPSPLSTGLATNLQPVVPPTLKDAPVLPTPVGAPACTVAAKTQNSGFASIQRATTVPGNNVPPVLTPAPSQIVPPPLTRPQTNLQPVVPPTLKDAPPPVPVAPPALPVVPKAQNTTAVAPALPAMTGPTMTPAPSQLVLPPPMPPAPPQINSQPPAQAIPKDWPPPPALVTPPALSVVPPARHSASDPSSLPAMTTPTAVAPPTLKDWPPPPAPVLPPALSVVPPARNNAAVVPPWPAKTAPTTMPAPSQPVPPPLTPLTRPLTTIQPVAPPSLKELPPLPTPLAPPDRPAVPQAQTSAAPRLFPATTAPTVQATVPTPIPLSAPAAHPVAPIAQVRWNPPLGNATTSNPPAQPNTKAPTAPLAPAPLGEPYVTTGIVYVSEPASMAATLPAGLKAVIESACGPRIRDLRVQSQSAKAITISFTAPSAAEARQFWDKIQALPELQRFEVNADVHLPR